MTPVPARRGKFQKGWIGWVRHPSSRSESAPYFGYPRFLSPPSTNNINNKRTFIMSEQQQQQSTSSTSASAAPTGDEIQITIRAPGDKKVTVSISPSKTVAELKATVAGATDVEADRQRLIYSGRVLKDEETVEVYKIR